MNTTAKNKRRIYALIRKAIKSKEQLEKEEPTGEQLTSLKAHATNLRAVLDLLKIMHPQLEN